MDVKWVELIIFIALFALVSGMGFWASRWRQAKSLEHLDEWGLGGRKFGSWITWFLLGGDLYTAYTFVAVPGLVFAVGAVGFFAVPYTILIFPLAFIVAPRLWSVAHKHGYVTPADFVRGRHGSPSLALLIAITGIVATMPYIALQLVGIGAVLRVMGIEGEWPLILAFVILAAYTYQSGLRAPALIAFVKDTLIYIVVITAVIYIPYKLGGFGDIFSAAEKKFAGTEPPVVDGVLLADAQILGYTSLAFGSALALFLYPHAITGLLASRSRDTIRRNMAALPAYSFVLGLLALLGLMAIAAGVTPLESNGRPDANTVVPLLFDQMFPDWFTGVAFAAIGIGALVPAAIMSIAAANLFTRNIYREYIRPDCTHAEEAKVSRLASLVVKVGAVVVILALDTAVLDRPAADRRRDHRADAAGDRDRALLARGARLGPDRRARGRARLRPLHAVADPEPGHGQGALRRCAVRAVALRARHQGHRLHGRDRADRQPARHVHRHRVRARPRAARPDVDRRLRARGRRPRCRAARDRGRRGRGHAGAVRAVVSSSHLRR